MTLISKNNQTGLSIKKASRKSFQYIRKICLFCVKDRVIGAVRAQKCTDIFSKNRVSTEVHECSSFKM